MLPNSTGSSFPSQLQLSVVKSRVVLAPAFGSTAASSPLLLCLQQDPTMQQMISAMNQPNYQEAMAERMKALQDDPEIANMMKEVEAKGPSALMK